MGLILQDTTVTRFNWHTCSDAVWLLAQLYTMHRKNLMLLYSTCTIPSLVHTFPLMTKAN